MSKSRGGTSKYRGRMCNSSNGMWKRLNGMCSRLNGCISVETAYKCSSIITGFIANNIFPNLLSDPINY